MRNVNRWDSSDPDRAPPPLPMNPISNSGSTKSTVSPHIQAVTNSFKEKARENASSPGPQKPASPERSLVKGNHHKRMQSYPNGDQGSEFLNYLESRSSPERPLRASIFDSPEKNSTKSGAPPSSSSNNNNNNNKDSDREIPPYTLSSRFLSRPILGENTPPSTAMLAIQNMQLPESPSRASSRLSPEPSQLGNSGYESLSGQIHGLTSMTSSLQRELAQLSRRSKDNATDLLTLKAATNTRDEDIRKSLRELSSNLAARFLESDTASSKATDHNTANMGFADYYDHRDRGSSPSPKKAHTMPPRMSSPHSFSTGLDRDLSASPMPMTDGSASIALLEKVLREMATKEGQKKLVDLVEEIKSRPESGSDSPDKSLDDSIANMLEEILDTVKDHANNRALVPSGAAPESGDQFGAHNRDMPTSEVQVADNSRSALQPTNNNPVPSAEILPLLNRVKHSVMEGGGLTNEVKALVRELRGEVLGMGRNIARQIEEAEASRSAQDEPNPAPGKDEIAAIVDGSLHLLKRQMDSVINESRHHSMALADFQRNVNDSEIYGIVKQALNEFPFPQPESRGPTLERDDILETVREAWVSYKPELEIQNFGLERGEILECLTEGLKTYQSNNRDDAVTYDQVVAAVQNGMQNFVPPPVQLPPMISRDDIILTIRECLDSFELPQPQPSLDEAHLGAIREEIWRAVSEATAPRGEGSRELEYPSDTRHDLEGEIRSALESGVNQDAIFNAVSDGLMSHFAAEREAEGPRVTKGDVVHIINDAFATHLPALLDKVNNPGVQNSRGGDFEDAINVGLAGQQSSLSMTPSLKEDLIDAIQEAFGSQFGSQLGSQLGGSTTARNVPQQPTLSRDELLNVVGEALENQGTREIEFSRDDLMDAISSALQEAVTSDKFNPGGEVIERLQNLLDGIKEEFRQYSTANGKDTEQVLDAVKDSLDAVLKELGANNNFTAPDSSGKDEIIDTVKEGLGLLQANMVKVVTDGVMQAGNHGSSNTPELLDAMEREFDHLRQSLGQLLISSSGSGDKDEILDAIHDIAEAQRGGGNMSVVPAESKTDRDEIIAALRESFENFRTEALHRRDGGESMSSNTGELLDAFNEGFDTLRADLEKIRNGSSRHDDTTDTLETIRDGLDGLRSDMEALRQTQKDSRPSSSGRGKEVTLADEVDNGGNNQESVRSIINKIQDKIEKLESKSGPSVPLEHLLRKEHLDDIFAELRDLQDSVNRGGGGSTSRGMSSTESSTDTSGTARKEDTDAIEVLLRNTKAQIDDLAHSREAANSEQLGDVGAMVKEMKETVAELSARVHTEGPTKSEIGTLETILGDIFLTIDAMKTSSLAAASERGGDNDNSEKLTKADLQTVEAMIFEVKNQMEELKIPDTMETLPKKVDLEELSNMLSSFREKLDAENGVTGQAFEARKVEHGGLADKIDEAKQAIGELGETLKSKLDGSSGGLSEFKLTLEALAAASEKFTTIESMKELTDLVNREFERSHSEQESAKLETEERDAASSVKQDEIRAAVIAELSSKVDEKLGEVMARYEEAQQAASSKFSESETRDVANLDAVMAVKGVAEEIKLVIGTIGNSVNETCERSNADTKVFLDRISESCEKMEEMQNDAKSHQEQSRAGFDRAVAATDRVEAQLIEFHPQLLESIQRLFTLCDKHYEMSQKSAEDFRSDVAGLPAAISPLLQPMASSAASSTTSREPVKYDDGPVLEKLNTLLEYTVNNGQIQEMLKALLEKTPDAPIHEKLDNIMERSGNANGAFHEMLTTLLGRTENGNGGGGGDRAASTDGQVMERSLSNDPDVENPPQPTAASVSESGQQFQNGQQQVDEKLDNLLDHTTNRNNQFHEMLTTLLERPTSSDESKVHEKLDSLIDHATRTNSEVHDKLNDILERSTNNQVHGKLDVLLEQAASNNVDEKLDTILDRSAANNEVPVAQMMKLDEMHKDIMQASQRMNEVLAAQSAMIAEDSERRRRDAEEATIALERRTAQREQVEGEIVGLNGEKGDLLKTIDNLKVERDSLIKQNTKHSKELSSLETALDIRRDEMEMMEVRAAGLEKRILEGVIDHARSVLVSRPGSAAQEMNLKRAPQHHGYAGSSSTTTATRSRNNSAGSSTTSVATKDTRSILGSGVGAALKRRGPAATAAAPSTPPSAAAKGRRIHSLSNVTGNRGGPAERASGGGGSLKRSQSVKTNSILRNTSWSGVSSNFMDDKENNTLHEEGDDYDHHDYEDGGNQSGGEESDTGTERRASFNSRGGKVNMNLALSSSGVTDGSEVSEHVNGDGGDEVNHDDGNGDGDNTSNLDDGQDQSCRDHEHDHDDTSGQNKERKNMVLYGPHSDSGLGSEVTV